MLRYGKTYYDLSGRVRHRLRLIPVGRSNGITSLPSLGDYDTVMKYDTKVQLHFNISFTNV
jgi:hypothetical protein